MFSSLRGRLVTILCAVLLCTAVTAGSANAASLPVIGTRLYYILGSLLHGGMIAPASNALDTTSLAGDVQVLPEFSTATLLKAVTNSTSQGFPYKADIIAYIRGTGSTTLRYGAACFPNPFKNMGGGTGTVVRLDYSPRRSPAAIGGDIGFVKSCSNHTANDDTASGDTLMNNVCTNTGCVSSYVTGTAAFNGADYIKFTPRGDLTAGYTGRITGTIIKRWGE